MEKGAINILWINEKVIFLIQLYKEIKIEQTHKEGKIVTYESSSSRFL